MQKDVGTVDWKTVEENLVSQWYFVCKVMGQLVSGQFPYFTFEGIVEEMRNDPNFKKSEEK